MGARALTGVAGRFRGPASDDDWDEDDDEEDDEDGNKLAGPRWGKAPVGVRLRSEGEGEV
jgi:hypothetical protein